MAFSVAHVSNVLLMRPLEPQTESGLDYPSHPLLPWVAFTAADMADESDVLLLSLTYHVTFPSSDHSSDTSLHIGVYVSAPASCRFMKI